MSSSLFYTDVRVYIAGVLMPATSVSVTTSFSNIPQCTITLPPYSELYGIGRRDRVPVHVFVGDTFTTRSFRGDPREDYFLFFEGEIVGFGYLNDSRGREIVINAQSHMAVLHDAKIEFLDANAYGLQSVIPGQYLAALSKVVDNVSFPFSLFTHGIGSKVPIRTPVDILNNLVQYIIDEESAYPKSVLSEYFSTRFQTLHMDKRFQGLPILDESGDLTANAFPLMASVTSDVLLKQIHAHTASSIGPNRGSIYEVIINILQKMEYELSIFHNPIRTSDGKIISIGIKPMLYEALPPKCNILFKSHFKSLNSSEAVYQIPTRIRVRDLFNIPFINGQQGDISSLSFTYNYWPTDYTYQDRESMLRDPKDLFASEILNGEKYTGPYLYDCMAPQWTTFLGLESSADQESQDNFKAMILKSQLQMKIMEERSFNLSLAFNPYITQSMPVVVYDADDSNFIFIGYVLSAQHTLSKRGMATHLSLGIARRIEDELNPDTRLHNTYKPVSEQITHVKDQMDKVYGALCGCEAVDYDDIVDGYLNHSAQTDPMDAYSENARNICTMGNYMDFMGISVGEETKNPYGDTVYSVLSSPYLSDRENTNLISGVLKPIAKQDFSTRIYSSIG